MKAAVSAGPRQRAEDASVQPPAFSSQPARADDLMATRRAERIVGLVVWTSLAASIMLALAA